MAELKNMTVQALRDLARKALGRGHSKLKTKGELIAALQSATRNVSGAAEKAAARVKQVTARAAKATGRAAKAAEKVVASTKARASAKGAARKAAAKGAGKAKAPARARAAATARAAAPIREEESSPVAPERREEPDADGYFVARVRGEEAVRDAPHPMTEGALEELRAEPPRKGVRPEHRYEEDLGELPWTYDDDALVALPRDPRTLYVYWDHRGETLRGAFEGLQGARAQIWILARAPDGGWERVRTIDFALEARSWFVHDLDPGRVYRAEIHVVDRQGNARRLQDPSNDLQLPPFGPSPIVDDKFMRIEWSVPLQKLLRHVREGAPFPDELRAILSHLSDWSRFVPTQWGGSGSGAGVAGGGAGGPGGRPTGPSGGPSSPSSPFGPYGWGSGSGEGR